MGKRKKAAAELYDKVYKAIERHEEQTGKRPKAVMLLQRHVDLLSEYIVDDTILGVEIQVGEEKEGAKHE